MGQAQVVELKTSVPLRNLIHVWTLCLLAIGAAVYAVVSAVEVAPLSSESVAVSLGALALAIFAGNEARRIPPPDPGLRMQHEELQETNFAALLAFWGLDCLAYSYFSIYEGRLSAGSIAWYMSIGIMFVIAAAWLNTYRKDSVR